MIRDMTQSELDRSFFGVGYSSNEDYKRWWGVWGARRRSFPLLPADTSSDVYVLVRVDSVALIGLILEISGMVYMTSKGTTCVLEKDLAAALVILDSINHE